MNRLSPVRLKLTQNQGSRQIANCYPGGLDTRSLSSKTMESQQVPGLYFIGEVVDVTGWLGGYNFQWAWSSAWACGRALALSNAKVALQRVRLFIRIFGTVKELFRPPTPLYNLTPIPLL